MTKSALSSDSLCSDSNKFSTFSKRASDCCSLAAAKACIKCSLSRSTVSAATSISSNVATCCFKRLIRPVSSTDLLKSLSFTSPEVRSIWLIHFSDSSSRACHTQPKVCSLVSKSNLPTGKETPKSSVRLACMVCKATSKFCSCSRASVIRFGLEPRFGT